MAMRKLKKYIPTKFKAKKSVYDKDAADYAVNFIQALCHTKGTWAGKPFELIDWQEQIIRDLFGTLKSNGQRQFNTAYIEIAKKLGKQLALDTPIPTLDGFTTMGETQIGDKVFDEKGQNCSGTSPPNLRSSRIPHHRVQLLGGGISGGILLSASEREI